jgi:peptidyl-prolyl cis-trans isomerase D
MIAWLQSRRKLLVIILAITVIAFVGVGFVGWGQYDYGSKASSVAKVGEKSITMEQLQIAYSNLHGYYSQFYGDEIDADMERELQNLALRSLVNDALLLNYAAELGIAVSDEAVASRIVSMEAFHHEGQFNKEVYLEALANMRREVRDFEAEIERQLTLERLFSILELPATPVEERLLAAGQFMADRIAIETVKPPRQLSVTEEEMRAYYEENRFDFMGDPHFDVSYIALSLDEMTASEEEAKEHYDRNRGRFLDEAGAPQAYETVKEAAKEGARYAKLRRQALRTRIDWRDGKTSGTRLDDLAFNNDVLPIEVMDALQNASGRTITDPIQTADGYVLARVEQRRPAEPLEFSQARPMVEMQLRQIKRQDALSERAQARLEQFEGEDVGFVVMGQSAPVGDLNEAASRQLLAEIFASDEAEGVVMLSDRAVLYRILEQKLFDEGQFAQARDMLSQQAANLKTSRLQQNLIERLQNRYPIEIY